MKHLLYICLSFVFGFGVFAANSEEFDPQNLLQRALEKSNQHQSSEYGSLALLLGISILMVAAIGIWTILRPRQAWYYSRGWWFKNAEPSEQALKFFKAMGFVLLGLALVMVAFFIRLMREASL